MTTFVGDFPVLKDGKWTGEWKTARVKIGPSPASLRARDRYWHHKLARDLKPRTLSEVYRENRLGRDPLAGRYRPRFQKTDTNIAGGLWDAPRAGSIRDEYLEWCAERNHTPHPASLDPTHPQNAHRLRCPQPEKVKLDKPDKTT